MHACEPGSMTAQKLAIVLLQLAARATRCTESAQSCFTEMYEIRFETILPNRMLQLAT